MMLGSVSIVLVTAVVVDLKLCIPESYAGDVKEIGIKIEGLTDMLAASIIGVVPNTSIDVLAALDTNRLMVVTCDSVSITVPASSEEPFLTW